jgi:predicted RNA binding protein YcfA (HicA-like mRNA interferase family)
MLLADAHIFAPNAGATALETNTRKIVARLEREGWVKDTGGKHDKFTHSAKPGVLIVVPRHKEQSPGVARSIAKSAGWV